MGLNHTVNRICSTIKKSNAFSALVVDALALLVGVINGFFLPKVFDMEGYAVFKAFSLYASYATIFSLGFSDGLYIVYGGYKEEEIDPGQIKAYYLFLIKLQLIVFGILFILSTAVLKDRAFIFFVFFVLPLQLIHFFRLLFRATGELGRYARAQRFIIFLELLDTILIVFVLKSKSPSLFIILKIINHFLLAGVLSYHLLKQTRSVKPAEFTFAGYAKIMKTGFYVLLADAIVLLIFSMDRWFVMFAFDDITFAWYSFAVSIMNIFQMIILSVMNILYSYMSKAAGDINVRKNIRRADLVFSSFFILAYFPIKYIITVFLPAYKDSLNVLWILMLGLPLISVINIFYINLYKATGRVKPYLKSMTVILLVSVLLNATATFVFKSPWAISLAMLATYAVWALYSAMDN